MNCWSWIVVGIGVEIGFGVTRACVSYVRFSFSSSFQLPVFLSSSSNVGKRKKKTNFLKWINDYYFLLLYIYQGKLKSIINIYVGGERRGWGSGGGGVGMWPPTFSYLALQVFLMGRGCLSYKNRNLFSTDYVHNMYI